MLKNIGKKKPVKKGTPPDLLKAISQGRTQGMLSTLSELVNKGILTIAMAAKQLA